MLIVSIFVSKGEQIVMAGIGTSELGIKLSCVIISGFTFHFA
jgi:hypothetical protein